MKRGKFSGVYAGEKVCAKLPISSYANCASYTELAVEHGMYSLIIGKDFHIANALKANIIFAPALSFTDLIRLRLFLSNSSSITKQGDGTLFISIIFIEFFVKKITSCKGRDFILDV